MLQNVVSQPCSLWDPLAGWVAGLLPQTLNNPTDWHLPNFLTALTYNAETPSLDKLKAYATMAGIILSFSKLHPTLFLELNMGSLYFSILY